MAQFVVLEHPLLHREIVRRGRSLPTLLVGPFNLMARKLWVAAACYIVAVVVLILLNFWVTPPFMSSVVCDLRQYNTGFNQIVTRYSEACYSLYYLWTFVILVAANVIASMKANAWWSADLQKRGYVVTETVSARSPDEVIAILATKNGGM